LSASARRSTPVINIDQGSVFPQALPSNADSVSSFYGRFLVVWRNDCSVNDCFLAPPFAAAKSAAFF
jgi:hypothetical protein